LGKAAMSLAIEERMLRGLFLCDDKSSDILSSFKPDWNKHISFSIDEKFLRFNDQLSIYNVFPWIDELSNGIDHEVFCKSFFVQPDLFIRLRPGREKAVIKKLQESGIVFKKIPDSCIALPNSSKLDEIIELDKEAVIQDLNSQRTGDFIKSQISNPGSQIRVWDCCAASGGKSIMAYDTNPNIQFTVSDVRESILTNLKKRFAKAGIKNYRSLVVDLANEQRTMTSDFDLIMVDAPCTGSGTWSRTPEQLYFFNESEIERYSLLQKKIVSNIIPQLQNRGSLIYITCSVFKKENEEVVEFITQNFNLQLKQMNVLKGYDKKADSMFVAVLTLP
jgi:16S rRNA (cytosine967-C5)-methyltransferase